MKRSRVLSQTQIHRLTQTDYEPFHEFRLRALTDCPEEFATDADAWRNAPRETINKLLINSETREDTPIFGARNDDRLVGMIGVNRDLRPTVKHKSTLWGFYVMPEHRKHGVGTALLNEMIAVARLTPDLCLLRAVVTITSTDALSLMEKTGFQRYGQEPDAKFLDGKFYDQVFLIYQLTRSS